MKKIDDKELKEKIKKFNELYQQRQEAKRKLLKRGKDE